MADGNGMVNVEVVDEDGAIIVPGVAGGVLGIKVAYCEGAGGGTIVWGLGGAGPAE